jgi:putative tryptophan/tyrosine transport system substrate-binding protein
MTSRRELITLLGGAAAWPLGARAQQSGRVYRLGFLLPTQSNSAAILAFRDELRLNGFSEGQNLEIIPGGLDVSRDQIDAKTDMVVRSAPDAIVSGPDHYTRILQKATTTIPIIAMSEDMVLEGLVNSLSRPGGNTTGISLLSPELDGKRQDLLIEAVPNTKRIAALVDVIRTSRLHVRKLQDAAAARGVEVAVFDAGTHDDVIPAIDAAKKSGVGALNFLASPLFTINAVSFLEHLARQRLPAVHQWPELAEEGGLIGYGPRYTDVFRLRARLVARVLRGGRPADIPVEQPTRFELVINLQTAKAIGYDLPAGLVLRADKVIE